VGLFLCVVTMSTTQLKAFCALGLLQGLRLCFALQLSSCCGVGYLLKCCYYVCHPSSKMCDLGLHFKGYNFVLLLCCGIIFKDYCFFVLPIFIFFFRFCYVVY